MGLDLVQRRPTRFPAEGKAWATMLFAGAMAVRQEYYAAFARYLAANGVHVLTFDYLGALGASLLFPILLVPRLGLVRSAMVFGILNVAVWFGAGVFFTVGVVPALFSAETMP